MGYFLIVIADDIYINKHYKYSEKQVIFLELRNNYKTKGLEFNIFAIVCNKNCFIEKY